MNRVNIRRFYLSAFLPLLAICSLTSFVRLLYGWDTLLCIASVLKYLVVLFLTYHLAIYIISWFMPRLVNEDVREHQDQRRLAVVVMMSVAFIALVIFAMNTIKVNLAILQFLPFYVVFILWKGCEFLEVDHRQEGLYMLVASVAVLAPYYLFSFIFNVII